MIAAMDPFLDTLFYDFVTEGEVPPDARLFASIHEEEGTTHIIGFTARDFEGLEGSYRRIILRVNSSLNGVGLTAAVSTALAQENIPCNIVAAFYHDHVFVPAARAQEAMHLLSALQRTRQS